MEEVKEGVKEEVQSSPELDNTQDVNNEAYIQPQEGQVEPDGSTVPDQGEENQTTVEAVDDRGVPWKNKAMELERKLNEVTQGIPQNVDRLVEEAITNAQTKNKQDQLPIAQQIAQYEQFAVEQPEHAVWARAKVEELREKQWEDKLKNIRKQERQELEAQQTRQKSEHDVMSNPAYNDAFVTDDLGNRVLNYSSPLTRQAQMYLQTPDLKNRPDAVSIAFKLAYADVNMSNTPKSSNQMTSIKRQNAKLKQATLSEGTGIVQNKPQVDGYNKAMEQLKQSPYSREAQRVAVKEALRKRGVF